MRCTHVEAVEAVCVSSVNSTLHAGPADARLAGGLAPLRDLHEYSGSQPHASFIIEQIQSFRCLAWHTLQLKQNVAKAETPRNCLSSRLAYT